MRESRKLRLQVIDVKSPLGKVGGYVVTVMLADGDTFDLGESSLEPGTDMGLLQTLAERFERGEDVEIYAINSNGLDFKLIGLADS
jgi:hypothetical protein